MSSFDPYRKWLGIPREEQPPNFYRLLSVPQNESNPEAIEAAAERQSTFVRKFRGTEHDEAAVLILFEIDQAKYTLLSSEARKQYKPPLRPRPRRQGTGIANRGPSATRPRETAEQNAARIGILAVVFLGVAMVIVALPWEKLFRSSAIEVAKAEPDLVVPADDHAEPLATQKNDPPSPPVEVPFVAPQPAEAKEEVRPAEPIARPVAAANDAPKKPEGNVALASRGSSAVGANRGAEFMLDGKNDQGYAKLSIGSPCVITLAQTYDVTRIRFRMVDAGKRYYRYLLEVSADGRSYEVVADRRTGEHRGLQSHTFPPKPVGFIRLTGTHVSDGAALYVHEFEAYCE